MAKAKAKSEPSGTEPEVAEVGAAEPKAPVKRVRRPKRPASEETAAEIAPEPAPDPVPAPVAPPAADAWDDPEWSAEVDSAYLSSKYTLVSVAAKRARQLLAGSKRRVDSLSEKPVTVALEELAENKLYFVRTQEGIK